MALTGQALTLEEFLELPEAKPALEYVAGAVRQKVSPEAQHSSLQTLLSEWINHVARRSKLAVALVEWRTIFAGEVHVPDVTVCRWQRIPRDATGRPCGPLQEPPLIAIEIASPGQSRRQLRADCEWYVANGVPLALLLDPDDETILSYRLGMPVQRLSGADVLECGDVLAGFHFVVADLFREAWLN
jgi:Uma2 family endonuclease